ncbi:MAG TPA: hypothetical protein VMV10_25900 [Pirellulales bacterium]|nr:hypothetical protein [Pirellulales bacterium]
MNVGFAPLLAIDQSTLRILGVIVVALIYVFNHFVGSAKAQQRRPPRADPRLRPPAPGKQEVNDEVAEFLRRTAERSTKRPPEPQMAPQAPRPLVERRTLSAPLWGDLVEVEAIDEPPTGAGVASSVQQHLNNREFAERARQLGSVDQEERAFEAQVHQAFDHQVGHLAMRAEEPAPGAAPPAAPAISSQTLAALLADPQNLRGAIVLNEILQRPTDRW